jgi:hypothetical protein
MHGSITVKTPHIVELMYTNANVRKKETTVRPSFA